ncbi:hypothetical protein [Thiobacter aerophilum]|uniref:Molecular chaperone n=1 Tax=Thiobacter aerophilum TaxID=3121275 RepID=A0ABV0EH27_9BURK
MLHAGSAGAMQATRPHISDAPTCRQWLEGLPLTNVPAAHAEMLVQMELVNHYAMSGVERLKVMEILREPILYLQAEQGRKYAGKPLPFDNTELSLWRKVLSLWQGLAKGYQLCLESLQAGEPELQAYLGFVCQRLVHAHGCQILEHHYAYQPVPERLWRELNQTYALAEEEGVARQAVKDTLNPLMDISSVEAAYVAVLLTALADPYHLTARQLAQVSRWLSKWAARVAVVKEPPAPLYPELKLAPVTVDLARAQGPSLRQDAGLAETGRYLDTNQLAVTLLKRIRHLRKGASPAELDVGEDCVQPACEAFLTQLYQQWCEPLPIRTYERRAGQLKAQVTFTVPAIHYYCNGEKPLRQPGEAPELSWQAMQDLQVFGHVSHHSARLQASQRGYALETWAIVDESALGFRLAAEGMHAARIHQNQLVAVRPPDARSFVLGEVRWLRYRPDGTLQMGVRTFPGIPVAVGVRPPVLISTLPSKYQPAFLLPEIPTLKVPPTLVLPNGWYSPNRPLEVLFEDKLTVKLTGLMSHGSDFDRVTFSVA